MSGGTFNYDQWRIEQMALDIEQIILNNDSTDRDEWGDYIGKGYSAETINLMKTGAEKLREAYVYAQRIDWLLSGDDGEDRFPKRLADDLEQLNKR